MRDFEPYFCISEDCGTPFDVPNTFEGLLSHLQNHVPECWHFEAPDGRHKEFDKEDEFVAQVLAQDSVPSSMMSTLKEVSRRKGTLLIRSCPFCGGYPDTVEKIFPDPTTPAAQRSLWAHIKEDMHNIAMFLPPNREDLVGEEEDLSSSPDTRPRSDGGLGDVVEHILACDREDCDCKDSEKDSKERTNSEEESPIHGSIRELDDVWFNVFQSSSAFRRPSMEPYDYQNDAKLAPFIARFTFSKDREDLDKAFQKEEATHSSLRHTTSLFRRLKNSIIECELSNRQTFLPLDVLHAAITKETVKAVLPRSLGRVLQPNLASKIEQDAKKIFAILVLIGEHKSISKLFSDGLRDRHLPLQQDLAGKDDNLLVSADGKTTFKAFANWDNKAKINLFFDQQWLVQAPVMDNTGRHIILDPRCALPFKDSEAVSYNTDRVVYRAEIHPAHIQSFKVHCPKAH